MPVAFVTGGTGFLGLNLIRQLLIEGWEVIALYRSTSNLKHLRKKSIYLVEGSITDMHRLADVFPENVDAVFHVAGNTSLWSGRNQKQTRDNVEGTRNAVSAALKNGAGRFIYTSSIAAYGHHSHRIDETTPSNANRSPVNYCRTKYLAEVEVRKGIEQGLDAVIVNPANIIGPYDYHNLSTFFYLIDRQKLPFAPPATHTFCHVEDVSNAHIAAYHKGKKGENYLIGGVEINYLDLFREIGKMLKKPAPRRTTPGWILKLLGRAIPWGSCLTGKEPIITPEKAFLISKNILCNSQKAERELGYQPAPLKRMLDDCHRWMLKEERIGKRD